MASRFHIESLITDIADICNSFIDICNSIFIHVLYTFFGGRSMWAWCSSLLLLLVATVISSSDFAAFSLLFTLLLSFAADDVSDIGLLCTYGCKLNVAYMSTFVVVV